MHIFFNIKNFKKAIFIVLTLINLLPSKNSLSIEKNISLKRIGRNNFKLTKNDLKTEKNNSSNLKFSINPINRNKRLKNEISYDQIALGKNENIKEEIEIQSEIQSEENNILYAEGKVLVTYKNFILQGDSLIYDKSKKIISAKGNVSLNIGKQIFKMSSFEYDFNNKKGFLLNVKGFINTNNLIDHLYSNFDDSDTKKLEFFKELNKEKVLYTPNKIENWLLTTDRIEIVGDKWKSKKAIFSNDLLELRQVKIAVNSLEATSNKDELRFKSSFNYLILDEKLAIPFWLGDRTLSKSGESLFFKSRWNIGFDKVDKDGYFIGRNFSSIDLFNDFVLEIEPQFLIQRSFKGYTKSFVNKGDLITGDKVRRDTSLEDYFALNSELKGKIHNWDLKIDKQINSFDSRKFLDALRVKANLSKEITFLNSKWNKNFYGVYRDRVWNGSLGEAEIYIGYGSKLEKQNTWEVNGINNTEVLSLGVANFKGESLNNKELVRSFKGNIYYSLDQRFPIFGDNASNKSVDTSFKYIYEPIKKGLSINTNLQLFSSLYEKGHHQEYIGFGAGPEYIIGDFKKKYLDYTRLRLLPFYKIKSGDSMFKFDQINDQFTLNIVFDQQLFGPLVLKTTSTLNLDSDSKDYGDFISSKISLDWKRRSYQVGIFYQPHNESGGINFRLIGFE